MTTLDFISVRKTFGTNVALEGLDLDVRDGELITLLGPSGCGKTTALRIAAGFEFADSGAVLIAGGDITRTPAHKRNMGMVFQSYSLFPNLTVAKNVEFGLRTRGVPSNQRLSRVAEMLDLVQLTSFADRYPHQISGGQAQRVALARALAVQPRVLLLDEPLSALDAKVRTTLRDEIRRIQTEVGITTLFVTHDQEEALAISDRICVMSQGRVEQLGSPTEVYRNPTTAFVARFVGSMNEFDAEVSGASEVTVAGQRVGAPGAAAAAVGSRVRMLVRPEDLSVGGQPGEFLGTAKVLGTLFQGATSEVSLTLGSPPVTLRVTHFGRTDGLATGTSVSVVAARGRIGIFPVEGGGLP